MCSLGWSGTHCKTKEGLELLFFVPLPPKGWDYESVLINQDAKKVAFKELKSVCVCIV